MKKVELTEAMARKYPEWVVFVITADAAGKANIMPAGWVAFASSNPPMVTVALAAKRYSLELAEQSGEFILAWSGEGQQGLVKYAGAVTGRKADKFAQMALKTSPAAVVKAPLVEGCALALECKLDSATTLGDHVLLAGRIVASHVSDPPIAPILNFGKEQYAPAVAKT